MTTDEFRRTASPPAASDTARLAATDPAAAIEALEEQVRAQDDVIAQLESAGADQRAEIALLRQHVEAKDKLIAGLNFHLLAVQRTVGWKILEHLRRHRDRLLPQDSRRRHLYWQLRRPIEVLLDEGLPAVFAKTRHKVRLRRQGQGFLVKAPLVGAVTDRELQYRLWVERHRLRPDRAAAMSAALRDFRRTPVISLVALVDDSATAWLRRAIESVRAQIYPYWELCVLDRGTAKPDVRKILDDAGIDVRIRVLRLPHPVADPGSYAESALTGEFVGFLDHDDQLAPEALFEMARLLDADPDLDLLYADEDALEPDGRRVAPFFKPDWSPDLLLSMNYLANHFVIRRSLLEEVGGFRLGLDGAQRHDVLLRSTERARHIAHLPQVLYHRRHVSGEPAAALPYPYEASREAIEDAVRRRGYEARIENVQPGLYAVRYKLTATPLVSIIIPTRDHWPLVQQCLLSIEEKTSYARYQIVVLDNDSSDAQAVRGLRAVADKWRVLSYPGAFNFSAICNFGAAHADGDYLVFLNNDTQVVEPDWLTAMLEHAQRPEVGAVGARLHYPDGRIQHAGLVLGVGGVADHAFKGLPATTRSYFSFADVVRNVSAVTAACMMIGRRVFEEVGGFDERLQVALNDVDLCLRLRQRGYLIVYTPFALLYHHESGTRGRLHPPQNEELVWSIWGDLIRRGDPYYNRNLTLSRTDWSLENSPPS
jgi:GT2 family glycosyltransferase